MSVSLINPKLLVVARIIIYGLDWQGFPLFVGSLKSGWATECTPKIGIEILFPDAGECSVLESLDLCMEFFE